MLISPLFEGFRSCLNFVFCLFFKTPLKSCIFSTFYQKNESAIPHPRPVYAIWVGLFGVYRSGLRNFAKMQLPKILFKPIFAKKNGKLNSVARFRWGGIGAISPRLNLAAEFNLPFFFVEIGLKRISEVAFLENFAIPTCIRQTNQTKWGIQVGGVKKDKKRQ